VRHRVGLETKASSTAEGGSDRKTQQPSSAEAVSEGCIAQDFRLRRCYQNFQGTKAQNPQGSRSARSDTEDPL
jgi:hypothetical protein